MAFEDPNVLAWLGDLTSGCGENIPEVDQAVETSTREVLPICAEFHCVDLSQVT